MGQVASESLTILKPEPSSDESPVDPLPPPLKAGEVMLILTDSRLLDDCEKCVPDGGIGPDDIKKIIDKVYGIEGTGQLTGNQVTSHAFIHLNKILEETPECAAGGPLSEGAEAVNSETDKVANRVEEAKETETQEVDPTQETTERIDAPTRLERDLDAADWVIFAMLDVDTQKYCESDIVSRFLTERSEQVQGKKVIVLALNAPYFLDVTAISKLSAYLGVYSKTEPFLENAVNVLFGNYKRDGAVPINVPGTRFSDLNERLQPDPELIPPMEVLLVASDVVTPLVTTGEDTTLPTVPAKSTIRLRVGPILDRNGHPVPDDTMVEFELRYPDDDVAQPIEPKGTEDGIATRDILLERGGELIISANSFEANTELFTLNVEAPPVVEEPTPVTTAVETPTATVQPASETPSGTVVPRNTTPEAPDIPGDESRTAIRGRCDGREPPCVDLRTLAVAMITMLITSSVLLIAQARVVPRQDLVHSVLWAIIVGLIAYLLYGIGLIPGIFWLHFATYPWGTALVVFIAMLLPILWLQLRLE